MSGRVIVGGGVAGSVAAAVLARTGRADDTVLLERTREPHHKVCGEFLSWEAGRMLAGIGFDVDSLGGSRIERVRVVHGTRVAEASLPKRAVGISRYRLDDALLDHAARCGARIERGVHVRSATHDAHGFSLDLGGETLRSRRLLLATGKSGLRGVPRQVDDGRVIGDLVGLKLHFRLRPPATARLVGAVELHLLEGGYAGLQLVEEEIANLCLLVPRDTLAESGARNGEPVSALLGLLEAAPLLMERLDGGGALFPRPLAISGVPYGFVHSYERDATPDLLRLGDQFAVVDSFAGDGMAIAVASGTALGRRNATPQAFHQGLRDRVDAPVRVASAVHRVMRAPGARTWIHPLIRGCPALLTLMARWTRVRD